MRKILIGLTLHSFILIATFLAAAANAAETNMRLGLWQITTSSDLLKLALQLSPDQMQNIKDLAKDYGIEMPQIVNIGQRFLVHHFLCNARLRVCSTVFNLWHFNPVIFG